MNEPLSNGEINDALRSLPGWEFADNCIRKTFVLSNFRDAVSFIVRLSFEAEQLNHHPELSNVYNRVTVVLRTHDAGDKVTQSDVDLAASIEAVSSI